MDQIFYELGKNEQLVIPGIDTSLDYIDQYIVNLFEFVFTNFPNEVLTNLNQNYGFTPEKRLRLIHGYDDCLRDNSIESTN